MGTSPTELSTNELCRHFFRVAGGSGVVSVAGGVEAAAAGSVVGVDSLMGGKCNGSGGEIGPFFVLARSMLMMVEA